MKVIVAGGGPAGMMAAVMAARNGGEVILIEKNEKLGKKLFITGKGRCNMTNNCDADTFFESVITNPKFLYSAYYAMDPQAVMGFFEDLSLKLKTERGGRVFPVSDHSSDVTGALKRELNRLGVKILLNTKLTDIVLNEERFQAVRLDGQRELKADALILALGGSSYPSTGSDGQAAYFSDKLGLKYVKEEPSLVPLRSDWKYNDTLKGLSLRNVGITLKCDGKVRFTDFGEMLFTHFGVSGPTVLSASCHLTEADYEKDVRLYIDLKPALDEKTLDKRLLRDFEKYQKRKIKNALSDLLPASLIPVIVELSGIDPYKDVNLVTKEERKKLLRLLKALEIRITGNTGFNEAIITRGGIGIKEINPKTMELKKYNGIYVCGEMIDADAYTGGFNLQIAWCTGALAGRSAGSVS